MKAARSVELAAFNAFQPETSTTYKQKMRSLFQNLKIKSNDQLRADVFSGTISPDKFGKQISDNTLLQHILTMSTVNMSGDELKSAEKRAADAALEKENMRVAMTATEQKAISTTYVDTQILSLTLTQRHPEERDLMPHPRLHSEWVRYGVFLAFDQFYP
jgi:transcription elongation factor S-II